MGSGSSCYPIKGHHGASSAAESQPYDAKRLLSELITVQTAIVLTDEMVDHGDFRSRADQPRRSVEYTITTSLTVPTVAVHGPRPAWDEKRDRPAPNAELQGGALMNILTAHFKHRLDVVKPDDGLMPIIYETSEFCTLSDS